MTCHKDCKWTWKIHYFDCIVTKLMVSAARNLTQDFHAIFDLIKETFLACLFPLLLVPLIKVGTCR